MSYLLLMKYVTPGGDKQEWQVFEDLDAARVVVEREKAMTEKYGWMAGTMAPVLVQHLIVKVEVVE